MPVATCIHVFIASPSNMCVLQAAVAEVGMRCKSLTMHFPISPAFWTHFPSEVIHVKAASNLSVVPNEVLKVEMLLFINVSC